LLSLEVEVVDLQVAVLLAVEVLVVLEQFQVYQFLVVLLWEQ
jgi:hypothetical protein